MNESVTPKKRNPELHREWRLARGAAAVFQCDVTEDLSRTLVEHAKENSGRTMTNQECTVGCVMRRGQQYVLVVNGKTYRIANQDHASLAAFAAQLVKMTGTLSGDVFTVSRVTLAVTK